MKATFAQNAFTFGEVSPRALGRYDQDKPIWRYGLATMLNWLGFQLGGAMFRPGTYYVASTKTAANKVRLLKFRYSTVQSYVIEAGASYMRFYANKGQLVVGSTPVEIATIYGQNDLVNIKTANKADVMYLVDGTHRPQKLVRLSSTSFAISNVSFIGGPFLDFNVDANTKITPTSATGAVTLTVTIAAWGAGNLYVVNDWVSSSSVTYRCLVPHLSGATFAADLALGYWVAEFFFKAGHVGSLFKVGLNSTTFGCVLIATTDLTDGLSCTGNVQANADGSAGNLGTTSATTFWAEGAFSDYRGWPADVTFHEGRLVYGGPGQFFRGSVIGAYDNFTTGSNDSDAYSYEISSGLVNNIRWLYSSSPSLQIGTDGGTFTAQGSSGVGITPTSAPSISPDTDYSVLPIKPVMISSFLYYLSGSSYATRQLVYSLELNKQVSEDMNMLADHILRDGGGAVDIDKQQSPNDRVWVVRADGMIAVFTRNASQVVMSWCRIAAGISSAGAGLFENVCILPQDNGDDEIWVVVQRTINGSVVRCIEYFTPELFNNYWEPVRLDSAVSYNTPKTITGATAANPVVIASSSHGYSNGQLIKIDNVVGMVELNGNTYKVANAATNTYSLQDENGVDINGLAYGTFLTANPVYPAQSRAMETIFTGLDHLTGETVSVQADGGLPAETQTFLVGAVTGGYGFVLPNPAAVVHAGLPYTGDLQLLPLGDGSMTGTGQGKLRKVFLSTLRLWKTLGLKMGFVDKFGNISGLAPLIYETQTANVKPGHSPDMFTGDHEVEPFSDWTKYSSLLIRQDQPLPAFVLSVILQSEENEK